MLTYNDVVIDAQTFDKEYAHQDMVFVDVSWHMPAANRDAHAEFLHKHIPGAVFFDQDKIADLESPFGHTFPPVSEFAEKVGQLGISSDHEIIVYEQDELFSAPRAWWLFKTMGAKNVRILNGGLAAWFAAGHSTESGFSTRPPARFIADAKEQDVVRMEEMLAHVRERTCVIIDARAAERFEGIAPEPRPNVRSGAIPGALNLPFQRLCENGRLKPVDQLKQEIDPLGLNPAQTIVTMCGSGMTAATLLIALRLVGFHDVRLYDGSWTEWGTYT